MGRKMDVETKIFSLTDISAATGLNKSTISRRLDDISRFPYGWKNGPKGKEKHFFFEHLPEDMRLALVRFEAVPQTTPPACPLPTAGADAAIELLKAQAEKAEITRSQREEYGELFQTLPESKQQEAHARYALLREANEFVAASGITIRKGATRSKVGDKKFAEAYNNGLVKLDESVIKVVGPTTSAQTIRRLSKQYDEQGMYGLALKYNNPKRGSSTLSTPMQGFILAAMCENPMTSIKNIRKVLQGACGCMDVPSEGVITRFKKNWIKDNADLWLYYTDIDAWRNKRMFAFGSASANITELNQLWEADSTPADLMLTDGRHSIIGMIDVYSRRLTFVVSKTSKAASVIALTRKCLIDWGVPQEIKTDNGKDYVSNHVVSVLHNLEVLQTLCRPFHGEDKPHIERAFRTFLHGLVELLPGYIGHNVSERKAIEARRSFADRVMSENSSPVDVNMSSEDLQKFCDEWTNYIYHYDSHAGLNGKRPADMVQGSLANRRNITNIRALDMLLMPAPKDGGRRTVGKDGIRLNKRWYQAKELRGIAQGEKVHVLMDAVDMGTIYVYRQNKYGERQFVCAAIDPIYHGIDRAKFAITSRNHQEKFFREESRKLKKNAKAHGIREALNNYVGMRKDEVDNIIEVPFRTTEHITPALEEGAKAAEAVDVANDEIRAMDNSLAANEIIIDEAAPPAEPKKKSKVINIFTCDSDRYLDIRSRVHLEKRKLTAKENLWLTEFYTTESGYDYLEIEGDLRVKAGVEEAGQAEA